MSFQEIEPLSRGTRSTILMSFSMSSEYSVVGRGLVTLLLLELGLGLAFFVFSSSFSFEGVLTANGPARSSFVDKERSNSSPISDRLSGIGDRGDELSPSIGFCEGACTC